MSGLGCTVCMVSGLGFRAYVLSSIQVPIATGSSFFFSGVAALGEAMSTIPLSILNSHSGAC